MYFVVNSNFSRHFHDILCFYSTIGYHTNMYPLKIKQVSIFVYSDLRKILLTIKTFISKSFKNLD